MIKLSSMQHPINIIAPHSKGNPLNGWAGGKALIPSIETRRRVDGIFFEWLIKNKDKIRLLAAKIHIHKLFFTGQRQMG